MDDDRVTRFERAFVGTRYLLGDRGDALGAAEMGTEARALARTLGSDDQKTRALGLAREIARIGLALDRGAIE